MTITTPRPQAAPDVPATRAFPPDFVWGAATAAYQIEGAVDEDGRGRSIWDVFSHTPGRTTNGDTGDTACDHYHRVAEDVALMADLGLGAYRFSIAWPRVQPSGAGPANQAGLDFYRRLVDELLDHGIEPLATLYHWDLPQALDEAGGWLSRETAARFADYAALVGTALGDRVTTVATLNEPWCSAFLGHGAGVHAPGGTGHANALAAAHHLNLAHGLGSRALRATLPAGGQVALTLNLAVVRAADPHDPADVHAARHVDGLANRIFLDPVLRGEYPADVVEDLRHLTDWSFIHDGDLELTHAPVDVLGVNYYTPTQVAAATPQRLAEAARHRAHEPGAAGLPEPYPGTDLAVSVPQDGPWTAMRWRIEAPGLAELLLRVERENPGIPMLVTENGAAFGDVVDDDGAVRDTDRIRYLDEHIGAVHDAIRRGANVRGYYVWSLLDNFEWAWGYTQRFGIVHVDWLDAQRRRIKDSGYWYRDVIGRNGLT